MGLREHKFYFTQIIRWKKEIHTL